MLRLATLPVTLFVVVSFAACSPAAPPLSEPGSVDPPRFSIGRDGLRVTDDVTIVCDRSEAGLTMLSGTTVQGVTVFLFGYHEPPGGSGDLTQAREFYVGYASTQTAIRLVWTPPRPVDAAYDVYRDDEWMATAHAAQYLDMDVAPGEIYEYRIELAADFVKAMFPEATPSAAEYLSVIRVAAVTPDDGEDCFPTEEDLAQRS
jgi:hypothetical protein